MDKLIYGKDSRENITGVEMTDTDAILYKRDGTSETFKHERFIIYKSPVLRGRAGQLDGDLEYKYFAKFDNRRDFNAAKYASPYGHCFVPRDDQQSVMLNTGVTMYKGMTYADLSILSFDIETNGLKQNADSIVYIISATLQVNNTRTTKLFSVDEYDTQQDMIRAFCTHVRDLNPDVLAGHNILGFDLPFLAHCSADGLSLGRDGSNAKLFTNSRLFRKDGHKAYDFHNTRVFGREIVDTFYLAMKYDFKNKYNSYGLKSIIEQEGLIEEGRQFYDAASIKDNWKIDSERKKIKDYCEHDSMDSLNLCDLMLPSYFYYTQALPIGLQETILTASGSQLNNVMVRSYLQDGHSIPRASDAVEFQGAISASNPGIYSHVNKVDVASLYPSIILQYKITDHVKDPKSNFLRIVAGLTDERLENKRLAKETGERYYSDLEQAQKIIINSAYGFLGAKGLNFNNPKNAALITRYGRDILTKGMKWVEDNNYQLVNVDTDSFSYSVGARLTDEEFNRHISAINDLFPDNIIWENDGQYKKFVVVKTKNYVTQTYDSIVVIKGSGLRATMKEPALKEFITRSIDLLLEDKEEELVELYEEYIEEISVISDITRWCSKKNITKSVIEAKATTQKRILASLNGRKAVEGDRIYVFFDTKESLCMLEDFKGEYDKDKLYEKAYKTVKIFDTILDCDLFINYKLKRNKKLLEKKTPLAGDTLNEAI